MQLVNHAPATNSQPISVPSLKLGHVVVLAVRIGRNFLNLPHYPFLPIQRKARKVPGK